MTSYSFAHTLLFMFSVVLAENTIFSYLHGGSLLFRESGSPKSALKKGLSASLVITLSSALTWIIYYWILVPFGLEFLKTVVVISSVASFVKLLSFLIERFLPTIYRYVSDFLPITALNCAVLGSVLMNFSKKYSFFTSLCHGFAASVGLTLAMLVFAGVRAKIEFSNPPKAFRGIPLKVIAAGLLTMAFSGFYGLSF